MLVPNVRAKRRCAGVGTGWRPRAVHRPTRAGGPPLQRSGASHEQGVLAPCEQAPEVPIKGDQVLPVLRDGR